MTAIGPLAQCIVVRRSGPSTWLEIDGAVIHLHPRANASVDVDGEEIPSVSLRLFADRVVVDNSCYIAYDDRGGRDGEADREASQESPEDSVRLSEDQEVPHL
jgi:hypothetical protein